MENESSASANSFTLLQFQKRKKHDILMRCLREMSATAKEQTAKFEQLIADEDQAPLEFGEMLEDIANLYLDYAEQVSRRHCGAMGAH